MFGIIIFRGAARSATEEPTDNEKAELKAGDEGDEEVKLSMKKKKEKRPSLARIMFGLFWDQFLLAVVFKLINDCVQFVQPQLLRYSMCNKIIIVPIK